jgi:diadenosine tetraphosphatase ApaH/serine/threonine PP2A family protein phosphatase
VPLTALISDLHSNWPALQTAVADALERGARRFVCLGDVIGYGASPRACLDEVMRLCEGDPGAHGAAAAGLEPGLCLLGNHESALLEGSPDFNASARAAIDWTREELNRPAGDRERSWSYWDFLGGLEPLVAEGAALYAHGTPRDPVREYLLPRDARDGPKLAALFEAMTRVAPAARVCFVGHSHVPGEFLEDGRYYRPRGTEGPYALDDPEPGADGPPSAIVNVGSVGQPRDGDTRLSYALYGEGELTFVRLAYDVEDAQAAIRSVDALPEYLADRLGKGR